MAGLEKVTTSSPKTGCVLRHHYYELHSLLSQSPTILKDLTRWYYSVHYIDVNVQSAITADSSGPRYGARILLDHLELKIEQCPDFLSSTLAIMKSLAPLRDIVQKMESSSHERSSDRPVAITVMALDDGASVLSQQPTIHDARQLKESFEALAADILKHTHSINVTEIKLSICFRIQGGEGISRMSPEVQKLVCTDLESIPTVDGIIRLMSSRGLIGYLNFTLLKNVFRRPFLLDQTTSEMIDAYERQHEQFICGNLSTLLAVFKSRPDLAPVSVIGLPEIKVTLNESWKGRSLYQWNKLMADIGILPDHLMITATAIKMNCATVTITYAVLPCFVSIVTTILSDAKVATALVNVGVAFTIDEELLKMGSLDTKHHELLIHNATAMIGHSSTTLVLDQQQQKQTITQQTRTQEVHKSKPVAQPPPAPLEGGYDDKMFLSPPPEDLQCLVCKLTVRDPQLITCCGAIVCKICMLLSNASAICPQCRKEIPTIVPDVRVRGRTMNLKVKCTKGDCTWIGELVDYHNHIKERCPYRIIECQYGCGQYYTPFDIAVHEEVECTKRPYDVIMSHQERLLEAVEKKHSNQISEFETRIAEMENEKATAQTNIMKLEEEKATLESQTARLKADMKYSHMERFETENGDLKAQLVHLESQQKSTENKLQDARNDLNELEKEKNQQLLELQSENNKHKEEVFYLKSQQAEHEKDKEKYEVHLTSLQMSKKSLEQQLEKLKLKISRNWTIFLCIFSLLLLGLAVLPYVTYTYGTGHMETIHRQEITGMETKRNATLQQPAGIMDQTCSEQISVVENETLSKLIKMQKLKEIMEQTCSEQISELKEEKRKTQTQLREMETQRNKTLERLAELQKEKEIIERKQTELIHTQEVKINYLTEAAYAYGIVHQSAFPDWYHSVTRSANDVPPCVRAMASYTKHRQSKESWYSLPFHTGVGGYKLQLRVDTDGDHIGVGLHLMRGNNDDRLRWPFSGSITVRLLNWREDKNHIDYTFTATPTTDPAQSPLNRVIDTDQAPGHLIMYKNDFISHKQLLLAEGNTQYLMDDVMIFVITQVNNIGGYDASVFPVWCHQKLSSLHYEILPVYRTIKDFNKHRENNDEINTDPFYTSNGGYKVTLSINPNGNGDGEGTHVSVFVHLMKGPNDDNLQFPITGIFTVRILNWQGNNHHIKKSIEFDDDLPIEYREQVTTGKKATGWGYHSFLSHDDLVSTSRQYLNRDMMSFKISFDPIIQTGQPVYIPIWIHEAQSTSATPPCTRIMYSYSVYKKTKSEWYSQPFYSSDKGYKLQLNVNANGRESGKGTHLSLYVYLMKGEHDDILSWPFHATITVQLLNWSSDDGDEEQTILHYKAPLEHRQRVVEGVRAKGYGKSQFISHTKLQKPTFILNDIIYFRIRAVNI